MPGESGSSVNGRCFRFSKEPPLRREPLVLHRRGYFDFIQDDARPSLDDHHTISTCRATFIHPAVRLNLLQREKLMQVPAEEKLQSDVIQDNIEGLARQRVVSNFGQGGI